MEVQSFMPKKPIAKDTVAAPSVRAAKPKTSPSASVTTVASQPRVKSVKHSKAVAVEITMPEHAADAHEQIAKIAYGYWEARGFAPGSPEQDWLLAEQEFLLRS
jgi:hypothetical protein